MEKFQSRVLVLFVFLNFVATNIYSSDFFEGIWRSRHTRDKKMDSYISIEQLGEDEYFIIHLDPYNEHQFDYATYGYLDEDGYIIVDTGEHLFFIEHYDDNSFYQNWNMKEDMNAELFTKVLNSSIKDRENPYVDFNKYIESTMDGNK